MTIHADRQLNLPVVVGAHGPLISVRPTPHWSIIDDRQVMFGVVVIDPSIDVQIYAARVAELLDRHGLADTPDTAEGATP